MTDEWLFRVPFPSKRVHGSFRKRLVAPRRPFPSKRVHGCSRKGLVAPQRPFPEKRVHGCSRKRLVAPRRAFPEKRVHGCSRKRLVAPRRRREGAGSPNSRSERVTFCGEEARRNGRAMRMRRSRRSRCEQSAVRADEAPDSAVFPAHGEIPSLQISEASRRAQSAAEQFGGGSRHHSLKLVNASSTTPRGHSDAALARKNLPLAFKILRQSLRMTLERYSVPLPLRRACC